MESRFRLLFLVTIVTFGLSGCAATKNLFGFGEEETPPPAEIPEGQVIEPEVERREIREPEIDSEDFEVGAFVGIMSIEDFGSDVVYGIRLAYHVTEGFFVEGSVGQSEAGLTSFEILSGGAPLLSDSERTLTYYNLNVGYNILPGEGFIGEGRAYNTALYISMRVSDVLGFPLSLCFCVALLICGSGCGGVLVVEAQEEPCEGCTTNTT